MALRLLDFFNGAEARVQVQYNMDAYASFVAEEAVQRRKMQSLERQLWNVKARIERITEDMEAVVRHTQALIGK